MNTTPLIDVLLVLLVMLILTIPLQTHAVKVGMPHGPSAAAAPVVQLAVEFDGTVLWNGAVVDRATMIARFAAEGRRPESEQAQIQVRADRLVKYEAVAIVLADAQRNGVHKIAFAGGEQYMD